MGKLDQDNDRECKENKSEGRQWEEGDGIRSEGGLTPESRRSVKARVAPFSLQQLGDIVLVLMQGTESGAFREDEPGAQR